MGVTWNWLSGLAGADDSECPEELGDGTLAACGYLWNEMLTAGKLWG